MLSSNDAKARAEANFAKKEQRAQEGANAWAEYQAERRAVAKKTERLRALRLAKEAADAAAKDKSSPGRRASKQAPK